MQLAIWVWACAVMFARVALGRHYPTDTLVGASIGLYVIFPIALGLQRALVVPQLS